MDIARIDQRGTDAPLVPDGFLQREHSSLIRI
jgi:hypothetical protein